MLKPLYLKLIILILINPVQDDENCKIQDSNLLQNLLTFVLGVLSLFCGSLVHWTLKIGILINCSKSIKSSSFSFLSSGYVTNFITFNMMRVTESTYKYFMNIYQGI